MNFSDIANAVAEQAPLEAVAVAKVPGRCVHVDGDMLAYQCGGNEDTSVAGSRAMLWNKINTFAEVTGAVRTQLHLTGDGSTKGDRYLVGVTKPYQGQRKGHKPKNWRYLRDYMLDATGKEFTTKSWLDREADDGFGYISTCLPNDVIATRDKDMRMLPGHHVDWDTYEMVYVPRDAFCVLNSSGTKVYGLKWFWLQMLQGDTADNIPGLPTHPRGPRGKVGDKTAEAWLSDVTTHEQAFDRVSSLYAEAYPDTWADLFAEQAILLWMRRDKRADLVEFLDYMPPANRKGMLDVWQAAGRIEERVNQMKEEASAINAINGQGVA